MVTCRVCQAMIDVSGKRDQHVVKCSQCNEATVRQTNDTIFMVVKCSHILIDIEELQNCKMIELCA